MSQMRVQIRSGIHVEGGEVSEIVNVRIINQSGSFLGVILSPSEVQIFIDSIAKAAEDAMHMADKYRRGDLELNDCPDSAMSAPPRFFEQAFPSKGEGQ